MKYLIFIFLLTSGYLYSQDNKIVYGNFVFDNNVYQYKCEKDRAIYKFSISNLEPKDAFKNFTSKQVEEVIEEITQLKNSDTTKSNIVKDYIVKYIEPYFSNISSLINNKDNWKKDRVLIDSTIKKVKTLHLKNSTAIDLLEAYKTFLNRNSDFNESTQKITQSLVLTVFRTNFNLAFSEIIGKKFKPDTLNVIADEVFYSIRAKMEFLDDEPLTAYLILKKKFIDIDFNVKYPVLVSNNKKRKKQQSDKEKAEGGSVKKSDDKQDTVSVIIDTVKTIKCKIDKVIVEFDEGTIKNIFIDVIPQYKAYNDVYGNGVIRYRNNTPISISSKFDPDKFDENFIFSSNENEMLEILNGRKKKKYKSSSILLSNILDLKVVPHNDKEDYSPANCVVELSELNTVVELKKEKRSKLFTAIGYSDLVGLNQDNQNGLVQIEINRRCNINTWKTQGFFGMHTKNGKTYTGWLNYIKPVLSLNKIETNQKYLFLTKTNVDTISSFSGDSTNHFFVNQLDIFRYRTFNVQGNLNIFNWNMPNKKISLHANYSFNYGNTLVADSFKVKNRSIANTGTQNIERIGSFIHGPDVFIDYKPENRFGLTLGGTIGFINILSDNYKPNTKYNDGILKVYVSGFLKTNDESKIFFRFAYNQTMASKGNNFYQMQLGYLIDLFTSGK
ncbi:MAG: hypothetical protein C0448_01095 [Sphingobacteriaceae bacterium]|nr:hypothetical protein [Sphingobacteriaceae bacterium]